jgi:hypothetical protein
LWILCYCSLLIAAEIGLALVNDMFPNFQGCAVNRFRCPFSFHSSLFTYRMVVEQAAIVMQMLPMLPFSWLVFSVLLTDGLPRIIGVLIFGGGALFNLWSLSCLLSCSLAFVANRYRAELGERRLFQLQLDIAELQVVAQSNI